MSTQDRQNCTVRSLGKARKCVCVLIVEDSVCGSEWALFLGVLEEVWKVKQRPRVWVRTYTLLFIAQKREEKTVRELERELAEGRPKMMLI